MSEGRTLDIQMSGGGPWGFRLFGGDDDPLVVAKLRRGSKASNAGLIEEDALLSINGESCKGMSHATAMSKVENASNLNLQILRGANDRNALASAFQAPAGHSSSSTSASPARQGGWGSSSSSTPPFPHVPASNPSPSYHAANVARPVKGPTHLQAMVNGVNPLQSQHREATYQQDGATHHVTQDTSQQKFGSTTVTKVRREENINYGGFPSNSSQAQKPMFNVAKFNPSSGSQSQPGAWAPSSKGFSVSAPKGVGVQQNPDQSVTMTLGLGSSHQKENIAPAPMFQVKKVSSNPGGNEPMVWQPSSGAFKNPMPKQSNPAPPPAPPMELYDNYQQNADAHRWEEEAMDDQPSVGDHSLRHDLDISKLMHHPHLDSFSDEGSGYESAGGTIHSKKKMFADSSFYDDPEHKYPTIEEQIKMARSVAMSLMAPQNKRARGHSMFMKRRNRAEKWVAGQQQFGDEDNDQKYYNPNPWQKQHTWQPPRANPLVPSWEAPKPAKPINTWMAPPVIPKDEAKSNALSQDEFEKMRLYEKKTLHNQVSPQMCFSLADDLRNMKGRGGKLFAKRKARSEKWVVEENPLHQSSPNRDVMAKIQADHGPPPSALKKPDSGPKMPGITPWDAATKGNISAAFSHLEKNPPGPFPVAGPAADLTKDAIHIQQLKGVDFNPRPRGWGASVTPSVQIPPQPMAAPWSEHATPAGAGASGPTMSPPQSGSGASREVTQHEGFCDL